jgi:phosphopentomutase
MKEAAPAKDTMVGHWELLGLVITSPLPTYPAGFPPEVIRALEARWGRGVLGNRPASGTEIIAELGADHIRTGKLIVYTSADSVLQIAAHEDVVPTRQLYEYCAQARALMIGKHAVGRVIARPFAGTIGSFRRISGRQDWSLPPPGLTALDRLHERGVKTIAVGKVGDILAHRAIDEEIPAWGNDAVARELLALIKEQEGPVLVIANFTDFDTLYGHRNDSIGFVKALERFDEQLGRMVEVLRVGDALILTADHGCDPTTPSTDHSREYVPLLVVVGGKRHGAELGVRETFADVGATICHAFGADFPPAGSSFWSQVAHG